VIVYFSSVTNNTARFVQKLDIESLRIPLQGDSMRIDEDYVLITPTYGDGRHQRMVPHQVARFLRLDGNRERCIAVVAGGNRTFGRNFGRAGDVIAERLAVPLLHKFELAGNLDDISIVKAQTLELLSRELYCA
jgi:protein involved in ribonucleotide reduction